MSDRMIPQGYAQNENNIKAYIPLQRKIPHVGGENFALEIPACWYLKPLKFALPPTRTLKFSLPPMQTPHMNRWNIGHIWSPTQNFRVGHVEFRLFVLISFTLGNQLAVEYGLKTIIVFKFGALNCSFN